MSVIEVPQWPPDGVSRACAGKEGENRIVHSPTAAGVRTKKKKPGHASESSSAKRKEKEGGGGEK